MINRGTINIYDGEELNIRFSSSKHSTQYIKISMDEHGNSTIELQGSDVNVFELYEDKDEDKDDD